MKKYLIFSPGYNENIGGVICLHYLAHLINELGGQAYLAPYFQGFEINNLNFKRPFLKVFYSKLIWRFRRFGANKNFNVRVIRDFSEIKNNDDWIVIYPEIIFGNPIGGKNIVRWFLHNPGFHTKTFYYGVGELHIKHHPGISDFNYPGSTLSRNILNISYFPLHLYNMEGASTARSGTAYCMRKGHNRKIQHDLSDSILIDGMSHAEISAVFKKVKTFISYDLYTAYSIFASLCGCDSVIIPENGISKESWHPDPESRFGQAYGFEDLSIANSTRHLLIEKVHKIHSESKAKVANFIIESNDFFGKQKENL